MEKEIWKDINGYEGYYQVSNLGRIRSLSRKVYDRKGKFNRTMNGRIINTFKTKEGYHRVQLCKNGKNEKYLVHRLVAQAFVNNHDGKSEINHKNANKDDNKSSNLEWVTRKENIDHSFKNHLVYRDKGVERYNSKLNDDKVREMRALYKTGKYRISDIAKLFKVNRKTAECAINKITWKHVI